MYIWDVSTGHVVRRIRAHAAQVNCVRYNHDSSVALSGSVDGSVKAWDLKSKSWEPIQTFDDAKDAISSMCVSDYEIITASLDGQVRRYDLRKGQLCADNLRSKIKRRFHALINPIMITASIGNVILSNDKQSLLVNCINSKVKLIDKGTGEILAEYVTQRLKITHYFFQSFKGHKNGKYRVEGGFIDNDAYVVSGSEDGFVHVWDLIEVYSFINILFSMLMYK